LRVKRGGDRLHRGAQQQGLAGGHAAFQPAGIDSAAGESARRAGVNGVVYLGAGQAGVGEGRAISTPLMACTLISAAAS
jgi:hypothetical protein